MAGAVVRCRNVRPRMAAAGARSTRGAARAVTLVAAAATFSYSRSIVARRVTVRASQEDEPTPIEEAIKTATETCDTEDQASCAEAWDEVEELSAAAAHQRAKDAEKDPLDKYCDDNPESEECRVYED